MITVQYQTPAGEWCTALDRAFLDTAAAEKWARSACVFWRVQEDDTTIVQGPAR